MKNIYKITKGQLVSIWFFGIIGFFIALNSADYSGFAAFLALLIPAALVFYTIGWRNSRPKMESKNLLLQKLLKNKEVIKKWLLLSLALVVLLIGSLYLESERQKTIQIQDLEDNYDLAVTKIEPLQEDLKNCLNPYIENKYEEELRNCNLLKGKIKHDYDFCVSLTYVNSPASCLYDHDFQKINCSEETIMNKARLGIKRYSLPNSCLDIMDELEEASEIIEKYNLLKSQG